MTPQFKTESPRLLTALCAACGLFVSFLWCFGFLGRSGVQGDDHDSGVPGPEDDTQSVQVSRVDQEGLRDTVMGGSDLPMSMQQEVESSVTGAKNASRQEPFSFWCHVLDVENDAPLEGVVVRLHGYAGTANGQSYSGQGSGLTDRAGLVRLQVEEGATFVIRTEIAGYGPALLTTSLGHTTPKEAVVLRLVRSATLAITVRHADGSPFEGVGVELMVHQNALIHGDARTTKRSSISWRCLTGANGECNFSELPPRVFIEARADHTGRVVHVEPEGIVLAPSEARRLTWVVGSGARIEGRLVDQFEQPIAERELWLVRRARNADSSKARIYFVDSDRIHLVATTISDEHGVFHFDDVAGGRWYIGPSWDLRAARKGRDEDVASIGFAVDLVPGLSPSTLTLSVERGLYIEVQVSFPTGVDTKYCMLAATSELGQVQVDGWGETLRLGPLAAVEHSFSISGAPQVVRRFPTPLPYSGVAVGFTLGGWSSIGGQCVDSRTGASIAATTGLSAMAQGENRYRPHPVMSFSFSRITPGAYRVFAYRQDGLIGFLDGVNVGPGEEVEDLVISLVEGARLSLLRDQGSSPARYRLLVDGYSLRSGMLMPGVVVNLTIPVGHATTVSVNADGEPPEVREVRCSVGDLIKLVF